MTVTACEHASGRFHLCVLHRRGQAGHYANEALTAIRTVHAFGLQPMMQELFETVRSVACVVVCRWSHACGCVAYRSCRVSWCRIWAQGIRVPLRLGIRRGHAGGFGMGMSQAILYCAYALSFWFGCVMCERCRAVGCL
jgi:hypothetical protein